MGIGAAIAGSTIIGVGSSILGSKSQSKAASKASDAQTKLGYENLELQRELANQQREDFAPWRDIGEQALNQMWEGVQSGAFIPDEFDPSKIDLESDPGYKFRMDQGVEALDKSAASRGRLLSGAQQKALTDYGQGMGSQEYSNAYARYADQYAKESDRRAKQYNILSSISGQGQASAAQQAGATSQLAGTSGNILSNLGAAKAQSQYAQGQARAGAYQGMAQAGNQAAQNWLMYKTLGAS